jgi:hypothetical protein
MPEVQTPQTGIWPRLGGPSGIRIGGATPWVHAFLRGVPIAGLTYSEALSFEDGGQRWLYATVLRVRGKAAALTVMEGGGCS